MDIRNTDQYFHIGYSHLITGKPCEDYALSGTEGGAAYAIVSDGCSSGTNTDIGSRIVALSMAGAFRDQLSGGQGVRSNQSAQEIRERRGEIIAESKRILDLKDQNLLATCVAMVSTPTGARIFVDGDGVVAFKYRDGQAVLWRFEWDGNMPFYPAYSEEDQERFVAAHGGDPEAVRFRQSTWWSGSDGTLTDMGERSFSLSEGMAGITLSVPLVDPFSELEYAAVFTDGVTQIAESDWKEAALGFLAFKGSAGEFAKRRMMSGLRELRKAGREPLDDIAYAVLHFNPDETKEVYHGTSEEQSQGNA
jgi:hypothetical protein